jgi:hypothetical protein
MLKTIVLTLHDYNKKAEGFSHMMHITSDGIISIVAGYLHDKC